MTDELYHDCPMCNWPHYPGEGECACGCDRILCECCDAIIEHRHRDEVSQDLYRNGIYVNGWLSGLIKKMMNVLRRPHSHPKATTRTG